MAFASMAAVAATATARPSSITLLTRRRPRSIFVPLAFSSFSSSLKTRKLVLYSKPGCCLCDGLKEKLQAAFLLSGPHSLHDVDLQVRDITSNPEWERAYQYEIPVLAKVLSDGTEETLPRLSPRLGVELIHKKIVAALSQ
ncbi:uncharacterized protein LOC110606060 isoform X1 [Manihot esculenta]|uniref:Glutaredoxin-like protein n=1 Tax=Manihot esculenta TaxID=3983 RepID=A0A2C9U258_MANES|nr:uncharacterized protein LOC110606060 isoform X1 [Manihot esculenta]OAY23398.1 hypothetical protein MANES_18G075800v8 [Manihot esculenta]